MERLPGFLSVDDVATLLPLADTPTGWVRGRQGTGYENLPLRGVVEHSAIARALAQLGTPYKHYWDVYLIRYTDGAHIPDHVDAAQLGRRHRRLNALLAPADAGGALYIDDALVELGIGDAVVFEPDREVHRVSRIAGVRLVFSVGAWI
jgi:2OG-Fe(II) oxygenase superfamily